MEPSAAAVPIAPTVPPFFNDEHVPLPNEVVALVRTVVPWIPNVRAGQLPPRFSTAPPSAS